MQAPEDEEEHRVKRARVMTSGELDPDQLRVIEAVNTGRNVFFTGPAGSGKSHVIKTIAGTDPSVVLTALTGIAAVNIGGKTIHSFAGVGLAQGTKEEILKNAFFAGRERWKRARVLVVDEVSMMSDDLFEKLDFVARGCRKCPNRPFGGLQVVFVGDFFQLSPVSKNAEAKYCFESSLWKEMNFVQILLRTNHRQTDPVLVEGLAKMRVGVLDPEFLSRISTPKTYEGLIKPTKLFPTNAEVDRINDTELKKLMKDEKAVTFTATEKEYQRDALKNVRGEKTLVLAVGAQVVHLTNLPPLFNGSRGVVTGFNDGLPVVQFVGLPNPVVVPKFMFDHRERNRVLATRTCIPLRLAWACTVHKSQGMTISLLEVDCKGVFAASQAYVAVSRARDLEGLYVKNLDQGRCWVDPRVEAFYAQFEEEEKD